MALRDRSPNLCQSPLTSALATLELTSRLYPRQTHGSALSYALNEGLRTLYPFTTPSIG
ncbi:hypothetical protein P2Q00_18505 [Streptomyces coacervatus]|uniref:hypothetical protein n=1 Tax=Streptomyces coacervatus TaxID=647381 RepID=UPI0023DCBA9F|nr:hypothetical protein [Streptomyces coacervatus]MDF2267412.1 hypothetical protein [Streptomyces coacervatus]